MRIELISRRHHGPVPHEALIDARVSRGQIEYRLATKRLRRVHPGIYAIGYRELDELGSWSAAVCAASPDAALARRSCGRFYRIIGRYEGPIEVLVKRRDLPSLEGVRVRSATLGPYDVITRKNVRVTSLPRTLLDLAGVLTFDELSQAFQKAMRLGLRLDHVNDVIARNPRAKGRRNLKGLVERHRGDDGFGRGGFENAFYPWLLALLDGRFKVRRNAKIKFDDGIERDADFLVDENLWIETDFYKHHAGAGPEKATKDIQRERVIRNAGFDFARYTDWEFDNDRSAIAADIREKLGLGARRKTNGAPRKRRPV